MRALHIHYIHTQIYKSMKKIEAYCFHRLSHLSFLLTTTGAAGLLKKNKQRNKKKPKNRTSNGIFSIVLQNFVQKLKLIYHDDIVHEICLHLQF